MTSKPIFAIMYDFDKTLCPKDMQEYQFIPSIGMTAGDFWNEANTFSQNNSMDKINGYMYTMIKKAKEMNVSLSRQSIVNCGKNVELFKGLPSWFDRLNKFGEENGVITEHYVLSSGLKEIIEGTKIGNCFNQIYASEFLYNEKDEPVFPKSAVNYTSKTQFVYRINKGIFDISNDYDLNASMPDEGRRVPFSNMLYIGDGLSDVPCMKMVKTYGGCSIAVYNGEKGKNLCNELLIKKRVDYIFPTDYSEGTGLDITVKNLIRKIAIENELHNEHSKQQKEISCKKN